MKKLPFPLATAAALALTASGAEAQSQVTIYGLASVEVLKVTGVNAGTAANPQIGSQVRLDNSKVTNSRLGFKGVEDLGGGLAAVFGLESAIALDTGSQANASKFFNRGSYVGLSSGLGALTLGRQWGIEDSIMSRYFIGAGYAVFQFSEFAYVSDLIDNSVKYVSPDMGGLTVQALVAPGEKVTGNLAEIGATYKLGDFDIGGTYRNAKGLTGQKDRQSSFGASYTIGTVRFHAGWANSQTETLNLPKATAYDVGVVWAVTPLFTSTLDYVRRDQKNTANDSSFIRLQGDYKLSKRTAIFANIVALKNKGSANQKFYGNGAAGLDQNVYSVGIRHWF